MLFTQPRFLLFFLIVLAVHWGLRRARLRKLWLLAASYLFYAAWDWRFLSLIALSTLAGYVAGRMMDRRQPPPGGRRTWLVIGLAANLGTLGFFKYFNFFVDSGAELLRWLGLPAAESTLKIVLPVGISFFTFQTIGYTIDVYRRRLAASSDAGDFALFVAFFPQLVAGPIVRATNLLPQLAEPRRWADVDVRGCLVLFLVGFIKKACISDHVSAVVDPVFAAPAEFAAASVWLATLYYSVQIYCDFSGYTDMAIACAGLLGYHLPPNFRFPYFSANVSEFWGRWHISLSSWLRDYLYIPLGGNRGSPGFVYRNLMITMLLGGLWHGAGWNFVLWGGLHGVALVLHRLWRRPAAADQRPGPLVRGACTAATFYWVSLLWIFFRAGSFGGAIGLARAFVLWQSDGSTMLNVHLWWGLWALLAAHAAAARLPILRLARTLPGWVYYAVLGAATAAAFSFASTEYEPFIYFQF